MTDNHKFDDSLHDMRQRKIRQINIAFQNFSILVSKHLKNCGEVLLSQHCSLGVSSRPWRVWKGENVWSFYFRVGLHISLPWFNYFFKRNYIETSAGTLLSQLFRNLIKYDNVLQLAKVLSFHQGVHGRLWTETGRNIRLIKHKGNRLGA